MALVFLDRRVERINLCLRPFEDLADPLILAIARTPVISWALLNSAALTTISSIAAMVTCGRKVET
jgi:hypothetical protein